MKRKLVKQGATTMMISLPSKWIKANGLGKGDEIDIEEKQNNLLISTKEGLKQKKEITININNENKQDLTNILTHAYRKGFNKIIIENIDSSLLKEIRNSVRLLLGFELIEKQGKKCIIENISEPLEQKYEIMLKKVFMMIKETQDIIEQDFKDKFQNIQEIQEIKEQEDKFILFCRRLLVKEKSEKILDWELLTFLMHIEHTYFYLYKFASENKIKPEKNIIELLEKLKEYFNLFENAYYNNNIESIHKINNLKTKYQFKECLETIKKSKNPVLASYIRELFRLMQIGTSPILGKILEKTK